MVIGVTYVFTGILGIFIFSFILDKYHCYTLILRSLTTATLLLASFSFYTLPASNTGLMAINMGMVGFCTVPIVSIGLTMSTEITYPMSVTLVQGVILMTSQLYGIILSYVGTYIIERGHPYTFVIIVLIQYALSIILSFLLK